MVSVLGFWGEAVTLGTLGKDLLFEQRALALALARVRVRG
jgi:hypothetical protein